MTAKSAIPDLSNIAAPSSSQRTGTSFALPITPQADAHPAQDEISEVGSSSTSDSRSLAHAGRDKVSEIGSASTPSAPSARKRRAHAKRLRATAEQHNKRIREVTEGLNEESDVAHLEAFFDQISQLSDFIQKEKRDKKEKNKKTEENKKENKKENELSEPKLAIDSWLGSKNLLELKEVLYEAINAAKEFASRGDAKKMVRGFLKDIGGGQVFNIAFIVVANAWERYEDMSKNKEACLSLLEEINKFAKIVIDLQKVLQNDPESKKRMEDDVKEAIELIIQTSIACCTQIEASKKSRYWGTTGGGGELTKLEKQLEQTYTRIQLIMEAAKELDKENIDGDFSDLINYISRLFDFIEEKKKGKNQSMPKAAVGSCLASDNFLRLKDVVSEGVNKDIATVHGKTFLMGFLKGMGMAHMVTTGFLVAASILERHAAVSANKEACLCLLKQMNILAKYVQELQQRPWLKNRMEARVKEATMLIVEASIDCCTQIGASKSSRVFSTTVNGVALAKFRKKLADTIDLRLRKGHELKYPEYPKGAVGIGDPVREVIERLEMGSDKNAVAVIVHGFGGMGKTTLADAVFAGLFEKKTKGYKYSYVRLFDTIASVPDVVKLQRCILTKLMMVEESEIPEIRRYEEGQQVIEDMLEKEAAFIYIDNVLLPDKVEQGRDALRHLLPKNMRNARKLRLLLTTRDKDAVRIRGVKPVFYRIEGLPHEEALHLFKKTLEGDSLRQLRRYQLEQIVNVCGGVPKLLKVVAGFISSEENVKQALEKSKNNRKGEIGNDMECYIFAYENLEETLKGIFLDICVFFQGWDWEELSDIVGESQLKMLEKRALVTKDVKSMTVRVHDVMLAIGLDKKGERFRFTRASDFEKFLKKDNDQLQKIKGIWSSDDSNLLYVPASKLDSMHRSLRVVILGKSTKVAGKCTEIFKELVIFRARDSDLPFDKSKLGEFKKLKLSHLICKSEDLEKLNEGSLPGMKAAGSKDSIFEIGSSSSPQKDSIFELGASSSPNVSEVGYFSTRTLPAIPAESDYAENIREAAAVEIETVDVNLSELSNYVSQLLNFRKGNEPLKPRGPKYFLPDSKRFFKLKEFLSEGTNAVEGFIRGERKTFIGHFLEGMEMPHMVATGFLVQANVLERYESISTNKEACLSLLNEMHTLAQDVKELSTEPALEEAMKVSIREATTLIVEASLACCTQIDASKFAGFFLSTPGMEELAEFEKELQKMDTHVRNQMDLCLFDAVRQPKSHSAKYPKYAGIEKPVRIKELLQEVIELLEWQSYKNAVAVILHGIGGMGKTTLADAVFARLFKEKKEECKFCFVRLFQDIKSTPNVIELQKSILRKLKGEEPEEIRSYEEGQKQIALMLEKEEAFIYIDNVLLQDNREQGPDALRQLLPENMANAKKLRLLITSRNKDAASWMTISKGVEKTIYKIQSLPKAEAETFLIKELNGYEIQLNASQIEGIVKICGGVPALLKVLAGFINGGEGSAVQNYETLMREAKEKNWKGNIVESIEQYVFVYDKLQDAYDKLEDKLKDTFLDVCSFFRGWDWKELSDIVGETELETLEKRKLVTRDEKSMTARVHGAILEVGLSRTEGNRFRLTTATEIEKFSDIEDKDLQKIKGIWASDNKDPLRIPASKLDLMSGSLRVLKLGPLTDVEGKCEKKFKELVFFSAKTSHLPFYVSKLKSFEKLRHLCYNPADLQNLSQMPSNLRHVDIKLNSPAFQVSSNCIQRLRNLRVLRLSNAQFKSLPQELGDMGNGLEEVSISGCQYLEELSISGCQYLEEVSIPTLESLRVLRMDDCSRLTRLAKGLGSLTSLQELYLIGCESLEALPGELENLTSLQKLNLSKCTRLKVLPGELENLTSLQKLDLSGCQRLNELPSSLGKLRSLRELSLRDCVSLKALPPSLEKLSSLRSLDLSCCLRLEDLPCGLGKLTSLVELKLYSCQQLSSIPETIGMLKLNSINLTFADSLKDLPDGFCNFFNLTELVMTHCVSLEKLPEGFGAVTSLRKLIMMSCGRLQKLPESFNQLKNLEHLDLSGCSTLEESCIYFKGLSLLRVLSLEGCHKLNKLPEDFQCLTSLEVLDVRHCHKLEGKWIDSMLKMEKLQILRIAGSKLLEDRWEEIQAQQCNQSWSCAVYTDQGLSNEENLLKQLQSKFDSMLPNISGLPLHTLLLVKFDGHEYFDLDFQLHLLEESIDNNPTHFEMVYFGNHFNKLPEKVANRIVGHAPANRAAKALFQKLLSLAVVYETDFDRYLTNSFLMTAEIVSGEKGYQYLSGWKLFADGCLDDERLEDIVVAKCGRYVKLKQLAENPGGSPIALLTELFLGGGEEISLSFLKNKDGESTKVGVDELQGKTILLDIRPANISFDIPLLALVEMYNVVKKEGFNFEIITVPIFQGETTLDVYDKFSRKVPWLVLENPWQLTNATKYFLVEGRPEQPRGWDRWYPNTMRIIESDGTIAPYRNPGVLRMVNTWGAAAYPFTAEKEAELIQKEETQMKAMSHAMFLFQHLERVAEQLREATGQQKMIWLCCCHEKEFTNSMKDVLTELSDIIYIIYIPHFHEAGGGTLGYFTLRRYEWYLTSEPSKMSAAEMPKMLWSSLSEYEAMRFWARIHSLKEGIKPKDQIQLPRIRDDSWMFIMDEDGNLITTRGKEIVELLSEEYSDDRVKALKQQLLKGAPTSWKKTLLELEEMLYNEGYADTMMILDSEGE